jgi:uncharacterized membrane protein
MPMQPVALVLGLWLLFGVSHVGLATPRLRESVVARLGERGFTWMYVLIASVLFALLVAGYAVVRVSGPAGFALADSPRARTPLLGASLAGFALMAGALAPSGYWNSPAAILTDGVRPAYGLERITRHPFFTGLVLAMGAHALLATRMAGSVFFGGFVVLATLGSAHQARKLGARKGQAFARYLSETSAIPFVAIVRGRQPLALGELPWAALALGVALAWIIRQLHDRILAWYGAPLIVAVVGGSIVVGAISTSRAPKLWAGPDQSQEPR